MLDKAGYPELEGAIQRQVEEAKLIFHPSWVLKLIQVNTDPPVSILLRYGLHSDRKSLFLPAV